MSSVKSNSICFIVIIQSSSNLLAAVSMRIENRSSGRKTSWKKGFPNVFHHLSTQFVVAKTIWSFCCLTLPTGRRGRRQDSICGHTTFLVMNFILTFHSTSYYWEESLKAILCPKWWTWMNKMGLYHVPFPLSSLQHPIFFGGGATRCSANVWSKAFKSESQNCFQIVQWHVCHFLAKEKNSRPTF